MKAWEVVFMVVFDIELIMELPRIAMEASHTLYTASLSSASPTTPQLLLYENIARIFDVKRPSIINMVVGELKP